MATSFSTDGAEVIQRSVEVAVTRLTSERNLVYVYEIPRCVNFIKENNYKKVALQFPDELLPDSTSVVSKLQHETDAVIFILADTSYGSCCVDEIAAQHASADSIVHFGRACLSPTLRLPVLYVFGHQPIDNSHCCQVFTEFFSDGSKHVVVMYDVVYAHCIDSLAQELQEVHPSVVMSQFLDLQCKKPSAESTDTAQDGTNSAHEGASVDAVSPSVENTFCQFGRQFTISCSHSLDDYAIFYIGTQSATLTNLMMMYNRCPFFSYDPATRRGRRETLDVNRALMKRYYLVERARDANVVGILVGTLGVQDYLAIVDHLKMLLKKAGKKAYTFAVGKLNVAKLANFAEIDIYVLVSCPENSLIDSREFYRPVVTPFEMELACNRAREWTGDYVTDFRLLLPGAAKHVDFPTSGDVNGSDPITDVSLITGQLRYLETTRDGQSSPTQSLVKRDDVLTVGTVHANASEFLAGRSWQGLETKLGETPVTSAIEGRKGIAASYSEETTTGM